MSPDSLPRPTLIASAEGEVLAERNMFRLDDIGSLLALDEDDEPPVPDGELVTSAYGSAIFSSTLSHHYPRVTLEHWSARPAPPGRNWELDAEVHLEIDGGQIGLSSGASRLPGPHRLSVPRGPYTLAVWCLGREATRIRHAAGEATPHGVEEWLLRLWPADGSA
ncbi:hypothetical protein [Streptomyces sp. NBC_01431]|uniref:hypothetical protein n=1 Tax=Streptomyces sp. NBC_01431 TaxID=2903863 RepID=UPI002E306274|nr:hypothetical protein [Streptomyces sp. NBC_01431]